MNAKSTLVWMGLVTGRRLASRSLNAETHCLQDILKYTERAGEDTKDLQRAVEVMCVVPKAANDMMNVGRLQGFRVSDPSHCGGLDTPSPHTNIQLSEVFHTCEPYSRGPDFGAFWLSG